MIADIAVHTAMIAAIFAALPFTDSMFCATVLTALSEADNAAVFAKDISRRVGFRLKIRTGEWRVIRPAEHVTPQKEAHGPQIWHSRRAG